MRFLFILLVSACTLGGDAIPDAARREMLVDLAGAKHMPLDATNAKATVLIFTTTDCPVANYFTSEINAIVKDHAKKPVRFFIVHVDPELTPKDAAAHAKEYGFIAPVLLDKTHRLVRATGATITPEAVVITPDGKIAYRGRIDDRYVELGKRRPEPTRRDLREALSAVLADQPVKTPRTKAIGCPIPEATAK